LANRPSNRGEDACSPRTTMRSSWERSPSRPGPALRSSTVHRFRAAWHHGELGL